MAAAKPATPAPEPARPKIYTSGDPNVVPPVVVRQDLPPFSGVIERPIIGAMEVVIDENGRVISATMRGPLLPAYDRLKANARQLVSRA